MRRGRILVTGADGFIGSHLVEELVRRDYDVRAFVYYNSFNSWGWLDEAPEDVRSAIEVVSGDVRDPHGTRGAVAGCEAVLHLAALIAIPHSYQSPSAYVQTNVTGTLNVLEAARELGVQRIVHTSTSEVYGTAQSVPMTEEHPLNAQSPYAATKIGADQIALSYHRAFGTPVVVLRPFNTYGPRQSARAVIPTIITQLLSGQGSIRLGALHPTRDFTYVKDTVQAFCATLEAPDVEGEVIHTGNNFEISIADIAELIAEAAGMPLKIEIDDRRLRPEESEVDRLWADTAKAQRLLGWEPEYGGPEGCRRAMEETIQWFRNPTNLARYKSAIYNL